ncbi:MAG: ATP citrate lyase, partial [Nitrospirae bacterium]|nr:ATP citrate lyase [Nitrospirota bacterium]
MAILANKNTRVVIQGGPAGVNAAKKMAEFCQLNKLPLNVLAFVFPPDTGKTYEIPYGSELISVPVYRTLGEAVKNHSGINTSLIYVGPDRAYNAAMEALKEPGIQLISMITEGVPEKDAKLL